MARIQNQRAHSLKNCQGGTAVDLSGDDNHSIIGYHPHDGPNQAWIFQQDGDQNGWYIKSLRSGQYLGIEGSAYSSGVAAVAVSYPFTWRMFGLGLILVDLFGRILAHGTNYSLDLSGHGNPANYTKVQLWGSWAGANQIWGLIERP